MDSVPSSNKFILSSSEQWRPYQHGTSAAFEVYFLDKAGGRCRLNSSLKTAHSNHFHRRKMRIGPC